MITFRRNGSVLVVPGNADLYTKRVGNWLNSTTNTFLPVACSILFFSTDRGQWLGSETKFEPASSNVMNVLDKTQLSFSSNSCHWRFYAL
jgi:hypothetical protein